jgi:hypothetical protein
MGTHPIRERDVMHQQRWVIPTLRQPGCQSVMVEIEQEYGHAVELVG